MTLPSHKKPPTTRSSTRPWTTANRCFAWGSGCFGLLLLGLSTVAATAEPRPVAASNSTRATVGQTATSVHSPQQSPVPRVSHASGVAQSTDADLREFEADEFEIADDELQLVAGEQDVAMSEPLERLKRRNAAKRWRELNESVQRQQRRLRQEQRHEQRFGAFPEQGNLSETLVPLESAADPAPGSTLPGAVQPGNRIPSSTPVPVRTPAQQPAAPPTRPASDFDSGKPTRLPYGGRGIPTRTAAHSPNGSIPTRTIQESNPVGPGADGGQQPTALTQQVEQQPVGRQSVDQQPLGEQPIEQVEPSFGAQPAFTDEVPGDDFPAFEDAADPTDLALEAAAQGQPAVDSRRDPAVDLPGRVPAEEPLIPRPTLLPDRRYGLSADGRMADPASTPQQLKRLSEIQPFSDYEPDPELRKQNPCNNFCPHPRDGRCPDCSKLGPDGQPLMECAACPEEVRLSAEPFLTRNLPQYDYYWEPSNLFHNPLYFEDVQLERYGYTRGFLLQPAFSVGKFAVQFVGLPYQATIDPIAKKRYSLGYYRPGQWVPAKYYQVPWNTEAALAEAGFVTGGYFLFRPW